LRSFKTIFDPGDFRGQTERKDGPPDLKVLATSGRESAPPGEALLQAKLVQRLDL